jgi:hypothetical protein
LNTWLSLAVVLERLQAVLVMAKVQVAVVLVGLELERVLP